MTGKKAIIIILWICLFVWMGMIFFLSSQNGEETAKTSAGVAEKIATVMYDSPSVEQVHQVHMSIRKFAHFVLFFGLGILSYLCIGYSVAQRNWKVLMVFLLTLVLTSFCGFFDEWHKQFIDGRHFDIGESILNVISGTAGAFLTVIISKIIKK